MVSDLIPVRLGFPTLSVATKIDINPEQLSGKNGTQNPHLTLHFKRESILCSDSISDSDSFFHSALPVRGSKDGVARVFEGMVPTQIASRSRFHLHQRMGVSLVN
ncbi:hypothetical protein HN873_046256 [Arachis hypogaea]